MSQKLGLDFVQPSPFLLTSYSWLGLCVLLVGLALAFFTWQHYQTRVIAHNEIMLKLNRLNDQPHQLPPVNSASTDISPETKTQIETTVATLTTPWNALLVAIEKSDIKDVALLSLEPSSKKQQVLLSGEAKNLQSVMDYINRLEDQSMLAQVYLQKHNVDEANTAKPVRFTLVAQWHTAEVN
jgi:hypothetical protein